MTLMDFSDMMRALFERERDAEDAGTARSACQVAEIADSVGALDVSGSVVVSVVGGRETGPLAKRSASA
jgi:hypothetical protein